MGTNGNSNRYRLVEWRTFREALLERAGYCCCVCGLSLTEGAVLQVHHRRYIKGRMPWEYAQSDCDVLCKGCHAAEHGLVAPKNGWHYLGMDDLGDLCGSCELCGTKLRYLFFISHPHWEPLEVGTDCCDLLTGTTIASARASELSRFDRRLKTFLGSRRWRLRDGLWTISENGFSVEIIPDGQRFRLRVDERLGKRTFETVESAKRHFFTSLESGEADRWRAAEICRRRWRI